MNPSYYVPQGHTKLRIRIKTCYNLSSVTKVEFKFRKPDTTEYFVAAVIEIPFTNDGWVYYDTVPTDLDTLGVHQITAHIFFPDGKIAISKRPLGVTVRYEFDVCTNEGLANL